MSKRRKLGELLVGDRVILPNERTLALRNQAVYGGRLGTNLVDLGLLDLEQVGQYLAVQLGVPVALGDDLLGAPAEVLPLLSKEQCKRYMVFPLKLEDDWLHLALLDPLDRVSLKELGLLTRTRIKPYVAPELLLLQALDKRYGIPRDKRFLRTPTPDEEEPGSRRPAISLLMSPIAGDGPDPAGEDTDLAPETEEPETSPYRGLGQPFPAADDDDDVYIDGDTTEQWERPPVRIADADASSTALSRARDRDAVINHLIHAVDPRAAACVLFMVRGTMAVATAATGTRADRKELERLVLPLSAPSLLARARSAGKATSASASTDPLQQAIARHLGWPDPGEACVAPVTLEGTVVNLLCVQATTGNRLADDFCGAVGHLCDQAAEAYGRLVRRHARPTKSDAAPAPRPAPADLAPPAVRPTLYDTRFFITGEAGTRSFARIWRAVDTTTQKVVAIYTLPADLGTEETQRVTQQALALQKLSHPALPKLHGTGITEEGLTYVVTEWLKGIDLRERLATDPVPPRPDVARLVQAIAAGLAAAHAHDLVHGDLTPDNVLLVGPDRRRVKLVNFGITSRGGGRYLPLPEYRAPELAAGQPPTPACDTYSLGVVAFEMLAGRLPPGTIDPRRPPIDLAAVPSAARKLVVRSLSAEPSGRPTAEELANDFARALEGPPLPGPPAG